MRRVEGLTLCILDCSPAHATSSKLNAEMKDDTLAPARRSLLVLRKPALAPRALLKAGKCGVVLAPLNHELLQVPGAHLMHPKRSEWLNRLKHSGV